jgi:hypothetical protein
MGGCLYVVSLICAAICALLGIVTLFDGAVGPGLGLLVVAWLLPKVGFLLGGLVEYWWD